MEVAELGRLSHVLRPMNAAKSPPGRPAQLSQHQRQRSIWSAPELSALTAAGAKPDQNGCQSASVTLLFAR